MKSATTAHRNQEVHMDTLPVFSLTIYNGRTVVDREQLPARAFSGVEAHAFARKIMEARSATRFEVIRHDLPAEW